MAPLLAAMTAERGHEFWPDDVSLLEPARIDTSRLLTSGRLTDTYLLALAVAHGGRLATLDAHLSGAAVRGGDPALCQIRPLA